MSIRAYAKAAALGTTPRSIEIDAFSRVIRALRDADRGSPDQILAAVSRNIDLWTVIEADVSDGGNRLPPELRMSLARLAAWMRHRSVRAVREPSHLDIIIRVNDEILSGLLGRGQGR